MSLGRTPGTSQWDLGLHRLHQTVLLNGILASEFSIQSLQVSTAQGFLAGSTWHRDEVLRVVELVGFDMTSCLLSDDITQQTNYKNELSLLFLDLYRRELL